MEDRDRRIYEATHRVMDDVEEATGEPITEAQASLARAIATGLANIEDAFTFRPLDDE